MIKRGDSFFQEGTVTDDEDQRLDISTFAVRSSLRAPNGSKTPLGFVAAPQSGATLGDFALTLDIAASENLSLGDLSMDIEVTDPANNRTSSKSVVVRILRDDT